MCGVGGYKYNVIQFLDVPYKDIADFVCVPSSWVQSCGPGVPVVKVSYPVEKPVLTEERVMKRMKKSNNWKSFFSIMRYSTDNYENAKIYIQQQISNSKENGEDFYVDGENIQDRTNKPEKKNGGHTLLSAKAKEKPNISTQNAMSRATINNDAFVVGMRDALGWCVSSKCANTITLKRKALPVPDKENCNKRFRVNEPDEFDSQVAGPSSKALDWSTKNHLSLSPEDSDEDLCTQKTPVNQKPSKTTHSLDPKIITQLVTSPMFAKWCMLMQELQELLNNKMFKELINKLLIKDNDGSAPQNNDPIASASSDKTVVAPKLNKEKINEKLLEEIDTDNHEDQPLDNDDSSEEAYVDLVEDEENNDSIESASNDMTVEASKLNKEKRNENSLEDKDTDDDDDNDKEQLLKKKSSPELMKKVVLRSAYVDNLDESDLDLDEDDELPPEYDANDSRWTLRYRKHARGLTELMPHTGVYVHYINRFYTHPLNLAKSLLLEIFTTEALQVCRLPGTRAKAIDDGTKARPALDEHAITVLMNYVTDSAKEVSWPNNIDTRIILNSLRNNMRKIRLDGQIERERIKEYDSKKNNKEKDTDNDDDKDQPLEHDDSSEEGYSDLDEDEELPPEYDANDSRWTLKYREPAPGNVELMPRTGVYVTDYKILPKRPIPLANMLLRGIFTKNALNVCCLRPVKQHIFNALALVPTKAKAIIHHGTKVRPALDEHAITVLMNYVTDHAIEDLHPYYILKGMRDKMRDLRRYELRTIRRKKDDLIHERKKNKGQKR